MIPPRELVLSGGGIKVISILGALKILEEAGTLKHLRMISGVSAGAWLGFMISCGISITIIEKLLLDFDFSIVRNVTPEAFLGFPETYGIDDGSNLVKFLESVFRIAMNINSNITFRDLHKNKIQFRCWATDIMTHTTREFSIKSTPSVKIIDALRASMAIPFYYTPVIDPITGHFLSDGAIQGALPMYNLTEDECKYSLGIGFCTNKTKLEKTPENLMEFIHSVFSSLVNLRNRTNKQHSKQIIRIPMDNISSLDFELSRERRLTLIELGSETCKKWLKNNNHIEPRIVRRHSV